MIYKIIFELKESLPIVINEFKIIGNFIFTNGTVYLDTNVDQPLILNKLKSVINDNEQIMLSEVNKDNLYQQPNNVQSWIKNIWLKQEKEKFEKEQQEALKQYNIFLDDFEKELQKQLEKGGNVIGRKT
jgi:hypothetical protein